MEGETIAYSFHWPVSILHITSPRYRCTLRWTEERQITHGMFKFNFVPPSKVQRQDLSIRFLWHLIAELPGVMARMPSMHIELFHLQDRMILPAHSESHNIK